MDIKSLIPFPLHIRFDLTLRAGGQVAGLEEEGARLRAEAHNLTAGGEGRGGRERGLREQVLLLILTSNYP